MAGKFLAGKFLAGKFLAGKFGTGLASFSHHPPEFEKIVVVVKLFVVEFAIEFLGNQLFTSCKCLCALLIFHEQFNNLPFFDIFHKLLMLMLMLLLLLYVLGCCFCHRQSLYSFCSHKFCFLF